MKPTEERVGDRCQPAIASSERDPVKLGREPVNPSRIMLNVSELDETAQDAMCAWLCHAGAERNLVERAGTFQLGQ